MRVTEGHGEKNVFDKALAVLDNHFSTATNKLMERHSFRQRRQMPGEAFEAYAAALRELSSDCNFGEAADYNYTRSPLGGNSVAADTLAPAHRRNESDTKPRDRPRQAHRTESARAEEAC